MRLYLSSYGLGNQPEQLVRLVGKNTRVAVVMNALDWGEEPARKERLDREVAAFQSLGLQAEELDLRRYFGKAEPLRQALASYGLVWMRGGNAFVLKRAIEQSGFDAAIKDLLAGDKIVYGGFSAGAIMATPTLRGIEIVDDSAIVPDGYPEEFNWDCLSLVPYSIAPHYQSDHPESVAIEKVVEYFKENNMPFKALRDGEVIVIED